jgi:hypothetical protein
MDEESKKIIDQIKSETDVFNKAKLLNFLKKEKDFSVINLANYLGMTPGYVCHFLRLLRLPEIVVDGYYSKTISLSHLLIISRLKIKEEMIAAYEEVLSKSLNTGKTEELVREKLFHLKSLGKRIDQQTREKIIEKFKKIDKDLQTKIVQTRVRTQVILTMKGDYKRTTEVLKKLAISNS